MDGWVGGSARKYSHFVAPSCKLRLARFSAELEIFQMGPSVAIKLIYNYLKILIYKCMPIVIYNCMILVICNCMKIVIYNLMAI